jgi:predicted acyltransferase
VLFAAGISMLLLATLIWMIDERGWLKKGLTPWLVFGTNALTAYVFSELLAIAIENIPMAGAGTLQRYLYLCLPLWLGSAPLGSLIWSILFVGICFLPVWFLYRRRIFIKL